MSHSTEYPSTACFSVHATAHPSAMPRVLEELARRGLVPSQWHSTIAGPLGDEIHMDFQVAGLEAALVTRIAQSLRRIALVELVLTAEKPPDARCSRARP
jgi:hypothetical protein